MAVFVVARVSRSDFDTDPRWSPDGAHILFTSTSEGHAGLFQVDLNGGQAEEIPLPFTENMYASDWSRDGKELYYLDYEGRMMSVTIQPGNPPTFGAPRPLFKTRLTLSGEIEQYDVTADGQRFVMLVPTHDPPPAILNVVLNWQNGRQALELPGWVVESIHVFEIPASGYRQYVIQFYPARTSERFILDELCPKTAGVTMRKLKVLGGWSSTDMIDKIYGHVADDELLEAMELLSTGTEHRR